MVAKKKKVEPKVSTLITSPACSIVVDGKEYKTGEYVPGAFPNFGKVTTHGSESKGELEAV